MAEKEGKREDGIDAVVMATPPQFHFQVAMAFLKNGIDVICEKPLTRNLDEAVQLRKLVVALDRLFCLTHCYSGYPMVRQARDMIASGKLGEVRLIEGELRAGGSRCGTGTRRPCESALVISGVIHGERRDNGGSCVSCASHCFVRDRAQGRAGIGRAFDFCERPRGLRQLICHCPF